MRITIHKTLPFDSMNIKRTDRQVKAKYLKNGDTLGIVRIGCLGPIFFIVVSGGGCSVFVASLNP
jgi:hypothetical protein